MKKTYYILIIGFILLFTACEKDYTSTLTIRNNISNVKLENVMFADWAVARQLLPGESVSIDIIEFANGHKIFPLNGNVQFYMTKAGTRVYLHTKEKFILTKSSELTIVLSNDTEVVNPMTQDL